MSKANRLKNIDKLRSIPFPERLKNRFDMDWHKDGTGKLVEREDSTYYKTAIMIGEETRQDILNILGINNLK
jgi:hypothetical protein